MTRCIILESWSRSEIQPGSASKSEPNEFQKASPWNNRDGGGMRREP